MASFFEQQPVRLNARVAVNEFLPAMLYFDPMENPYLSMLVTALGHLVPVLPYFAGLLVVVLALKVMEAKLVRARRRRWKDSSAWGRGRGTSASFDTSPVPLPNKVPDAADQLRTVMQAEFKPQPLLNKSEARLFLTLEKIVADISPGWRVMAQVSLGEILRSPDVGAYRCINSKRVDLLIIDGECKPLHAIEYQGRGHFKGADATAARDAVKKEALRRAGIGYLEVVAGDTPAELRRVLERLVQKADA